MNTAAVVGCLVYCARPSLTLLALRNTLARDDAAALQGCVQCVHEEPACLWVAGFGSMLGKVA